jgi:asparagine synthase (glutamine-hydrolysing)
MYGICGVYRFGGPEPDDKAVVSRMCARLRNRGPDDQGVASTGSVTLGNRRLAILDLTSAGHQPMTTRDGRFTVTFNGEIYNHRDLAKEMNLAPGELRSIRAIGVMIASNFPIMGSISIQCRSRGPSAVVPEDRSR